MGDILKSLGIGTYTTKDGKVITNKDLPPDVQEEVVRRGAQRDLSKDAGPNDSPAVAKAQAGVNELYDPATRDKAMAPVRARKIAEELSRRLDANDRTRK